MRTQRHLFLVLAVCVLLPLAAWAGRLEDVRTRGVLRVGTTGDYKPFSYRATETSPFVGLDIELAGQFAQALGVRVEWVPTTWPTLMRDFEADRFDLAMSGVSISAERERVAFFSVAYLRDGKTPIARCENQTRFQTLAQIDQPGVRVVVNPGGTNERFVRAHLRRASIAVWPDNITIFDRIVAGEADLMITDAIETRLQQALRPQLCAVHPETPFEVSAKACLLPRDPQWKAAVDAWLRPQVERGEVNRLLEKWLTHPWPRAAADAIDMAPLCELIAERLAAMPDVARYKWNQRAAIDDPAREQQIIDGLKRDAEAYGVTAQWAERFFRAQIEAAKLVQRAQFARWEQAGQGKFAAVPDLATEIRPRLDALTPRLLGELARAWPALADPAQRSRIVATAQRVLAQAGLDATTIECALAPWQEAGARDEKR